MANPNNAQNQDRLRDLEQKERENQSLTKEEREELQTLREERDAKPQA